MVKKSIRDPDELSLDQTMDCLRRIGDPGESNPMVRDMRYGFRDALERLSRPINTTTGAYRGYEVGQRVCEALEWMELLKLDSESPEKT